MRMILSSVVAIGLLGFAGIAPIAAQSSSDAAHSTVQGGAVTVVANSTAGGATIDYIHAKPMKLPTAPGRSEAAATEDLIALKSGTGRKIDESDILALRRLMRLRRRKRAN